MKALFATFVVFSLLCSSAGGYFLWVQHNEIQALQFGVKTLNNDVDRLSASLKKDQSVQKRILDDEKRIVQNQKTFYENQKVLADAVNKILDALTTPESDHRSKL